MALLSAAVGELDEGTKCAARLDRRFMADDMAGRQTLLYLQAAVLFVRSGN